jgi:hypothetical protein
MEEGIRLLELAQRAGRLFRTAPSGQQREMLNLVLSNPVWRDGQLLTDFKQPFAMLAETTAIVAQSLMPSGEGASRLPCWPYRLPQRSTARAVCSSGTLLLRTIRQTEHHVLAGPLSRGIAKTGHAYASRLLSLYGSLDQLRREKRKRDRHIDLPNAALFACRDLLDAGDASDHDLIKPAPATRDRGDECSPGLGTDRSTVLGRDGFFGVPLGAQIAFQTSPCAQKHHRSGLSLIRNFSIWKAPGVPSLASPRPAVQRCQ